MGHITGGPVYEKLQKRLDRTLEGAPASEALFGILRRLFTEEEAELAMRMPMRPSSLDGLEKRLKMPREKLGRLLDSMADKGLVLDMHDERKGKSYYYLAPPLVGFFEFSMMRARDDVPQKEISLLMYECLDGDQGFLKTVFSGDMQLARAMINETALDEEQMSAVLSYEKASEIISEADAHAVALCYCRHKAEHAEHPCKFPMDNCLSINGGAKTLSGRGLSRRIEKAEALDILARSRELGLVQVADNVQKEVSFMCNCCGCCCGLLNSLGKRRTTRTIMTSNFIAAVDEDTCNGCGACARRCPIKAIEVQGKTEESRGHAVVEEEVCIGCGVCEAACKFDSLFMRKRSKRVVTPENTMTRVLQMAVERGKIQNYLFDDFEDDGQEFMRRAVSTILNLPPTQMLLASDQLKSRFIKRLASLAG